MLRLQGPSEIYAHRGVHSPETYRAAAERAGELLDRDLPLYAHVSEGRWVADCPCCNAGIAIHPEWPNAYCFGCHAAFSDIRIPSDWPEVERLLMLRPVPRNRNFRRHESVVHLIHENVAHGVEI
jgi:hypothetical protein